MNRQRTTLETSRLIKAFETSRLIKAFSGISFTLTIINRQNAYAECINGPQVPTGNSLTEQGKWEAASS